MATPCHIEKLKRETYLRYLFAKHHVAPGSQAASFEEVINSVVGVHSARLPTPYVAFQARMNGITPADYRSATYGSNRLIKLRCMRKTLHTVTQELAPIVHVATLALRTAGFQLQFERNGFKLDTVEDVTLEALNTELKTPQSHKQVLLWLSLRLSQLKPNLSFKKANGLARILLKWAWETGRICYLNRAAHWTREMRFYGSTASLYPRLTLNAYTREQAVRELVARHVRAFEPVSEQDIAWWSGISVKEVRAALQRLAPRLLRVGLEGVADNLLMTQDGFHEYVRLRQQTDTLPWCAFLAYEDPTLKGYFDTRTRYVDQADYGKLFNQIGEVRPSVHINGRAVGIWSWNVKASRISVQLFRSLSNDERAAISLKRQELEAFLDETTQLKLLLDSSGA